MSEVIIALGTNLGKKCRNLLAAIRAMQRLGIEVKRHSCLYETAPVGITDQPEFLNAAVLANTTSSPIDLLSKLKSIENDMGRDFSVERHGPRIIDLDIIFYNNQAHTSLKCEIPHPRWQERDFVKFPLMDLAMGYSPNDDIQSKVMEPMQKIRQISLAENRDAIRQVCTLDGETPECIGESTWSMLVMNITPDSFSDGGAFLTAGEGLNEEAVLQCARKAVDHKIKILDIGGQSTRPGSVYVKVEEELRRVLPVIKLLRKELGDTCPYLSIDTFSASVAREAIAAGAHLINDVTGGKHDPEMLSTVAELGVPYVLMHMRGTPQTMTKREHTLYSADPVVDVGMELQSSAEAAMEAGIPAWNIILDPGIGFAKVLETSFDIVVNLNRLKTDVFRGTCAKMPLLIGHSRKKFLSKFTRTRGAENRDVISAAMALHCIRNGADIIRMHNVQMMQETIALADALYRTHRLP